MERATLYHYHEGQAVQLQALSWEGVKATAKAHFADVDTGADFYVEYKDEEEDTIRVAREEELAEALKWAEERGHVLCLQVPKDELSDDEGSRDWVDVEEMDTPARELPSMDGGNEEDVSERIHLAEKELQGGEEEEEEEASKVLPKVLPKEEAAPVPKQEQPDLVEEQEAVVEEPEEEEEKETLKEEAPVSPSINEELVDQKLTLFINRVVALATNKPEDHDTDQLVESAKRALASPNELLGFVRDENVGKAMAQVALMELEDPGSAATLAVSKAMMCSQSVAKLLAHAPDSEDFLVNLLALLVSRQQQKQHQGTEQEAEFTVRVSHPRVVCDGCQANHVHQKESFDKGYCFENRCIAGVRYKSAVMEDFDLCECCEARGEFQSTHGPFLKITDPATAPEGILCIMPGASSRGLEKLDWRNPLAREFKDFVETKHDRAFKRGAAPPPPPPPPPAVVPEAAASDPVAPPPPLVCPPSAVAYPVVTPRAPPPASNNQSQDTRCTHTLKEFKTHHQGFSCDICMQRQPRDVSMHGCRICNFDVCEGCQIARGVLAAAATPAATAPPQAKFVSDGTLADGSVVRPLERVAKTWKIRNTGAEPWKEGTRLIHVGGDILGGPEDGVLVPLAQPHQAVDASVPLHMPSTPGRYTSYWRLISPASQGRVKFGHRLWVTVNVVNAPPPNAVPRPMFGTGNRVGFPGLVVGAMPERTAAAPPPPPPEQPSAPSRVAEVDATAPPAAEEEWVVSPELEQAVSQITEFGFHDIDKIVKILKEVNGDTSRAIDRLLESAAE